MTDERERREESPTPDSAPDSAAPDSAAPDTQDNHDAETDEDTASGGAPADPDPAHF